MSEFVKVGQVQQFRKGRGRAVDVGGVKVAVFWTGERFLAVGDKCAHMGASLADGTIEDGKVVCSWHGWAYDVETGQSTARPWACTPVYDVKVEGDDVLVRQHEAPTVP